MIVDDEKDSQLLFDHEFRMEIKDGKIQFIYTSSGEEALNYLETKGIADIILILSDINMPGINGLELLKIIKERFNTIPVVMLTAYGDQENYNKAMLYGADDFINKPIDFKYLRKEIMAFYESKKSEK